MGMKKHKAGQIATQLRAIYSRELLLDAARGVSTEAHQAALGFLRRNIEKFPRELKEEANIILGN